jgi:hypothetical protein
MPYFTKLGKTWRLERSLPTPHTHYPHPENRNSPSRRLLS